MKHPLPGISVEMLKVYKRAFIEIIIKRYRVLNICSAIELKKSKGYFNIYITVEI